MSAYLLRIARTSDQIFIDLGAENGFLGIAGAQLNKDYENLFHVNE
jgi:hypothetical protein